MVAAEWNAAKWTLLGLLVEEPDYAYRLTQRYESEVRRCQGALPMLSDSSVDKYVKSLARAGAAERIGRKPRGRNTHVVRVYWKASAEGERLHGRWVVRQFAQHPPRVDLLSRWAGASERDRLALLQRYRRECLAQLEQLPRVEPMNGEEVAHLTRDERGERHAVIFERTRIEADLRYATLVISELRAVVEYSDASDEGDDERVAVA